MPSKILVAYYTRTANTRAVAETIQRLSGGDLAEISPLVPYPPSYQATLKQAQAEIKANVRSAIESMDRNPGAYGTVFVGSPIWWGTLAPPVATFLATPGLSGKTLIPFCTHGGGGAGRLESDMAELCPDALLLPGLAVRGNGGSTLDALIAAWLAKIGVTQG